MLRIKTIRMKNFGAFKGDQSFDLPEEEGISIFYGENMRGKTTLLNAFRFALIGKIIGRGRRQVSFHDMINWEARSEGERSFEVSIDLSHAGAEYRLTRSCKPKKGASAPEGHDDYVTEYFLERGGHILAPQQAELELERILPEQISRFFLFDGELLQEYEDLMHSESDIGRKISNAIERILGLPTLTKSRDSLKAALDRAESNVALAAQGDQKTREYGNQLQSLVDEREILTKDLFRQEGELEELRGRKAAIEDDMRRRERMGALIDKRDRLKEEIDALKQSVDEQTEEVTSAMSSAWSAVIRTRLKTAVDEHRRRENELQSLINRAQILKELAEGDERSCPTCLQAVTEEAQEKIRALLPKGDEEDSFEAQRELAGVRRRLDALENQLESSNPQALRQLWRSLEASKLEIYAKQGEIEEIEKQLSSNAEDELRGLRREYDSVFRQITALETGVAETGEKLEENANYRENIQKKLDKLAGGETDLAIKRRDYTSRVHALFAASVDTYREQLRRRVEADASRFFQQLTTEPEYAGLRINDNYGLTIVHRDGSDVPVRSAGAEHVVALSLVAALQNNAQLRGPIVIDSPFGRLDGGHRANIVETLPNMADQVIVLVYEEELPPARAREALKGRLRAEWTLERQSARHTELVRQ